MKNKFFTVVTLILVSVFFVCLAVGCGKNTENATASEGETVSAAESGPLQISEIFSYTGAFVEDGSDTQKENICAVKIKNNSSADWQYLNICLTTDSGELYFEVTTLFANTEITVLEKNATPFTEGLQVTKTEYINQAEFSETPSTHPELFEFTAVDSIINIENISQSDITGDIYVYYKSVVDNDFFGGITYRIKIEGGIAAGEIKQLSASHFKADSSKVVFVTYAE